MKERILFQNEACMVINKLPGESSEFPEAGGGKEKPVHRLDMPVSGCLLLARTPEAAAFLGDAFARRQARSLPSATANAPGRIEKRYWAIIEKPRKEIPFNDELVHWISFDSVKNKS